jgi:hypothetical protein
MPWLLGEEPSPTTLQTTSQAISSLSKRFPKPTNSVALAAIGAVWEATSADAAKKEGLREDIADAFLLPLGVLPRMRLLAVGWTKPGDSFKSAQDAGWWKRPWHKGGDYLWNPLATWAAAIQKAGLGGNFGFDEEIAKGYPEAISDAIAGVRVDLKLIQDARADICAPYLIPRVKGVIPDPQVVCLARVAAEQNRERIEEEVRKSPIANPPTVAIPWWAWVAVGWIAITVTSRRK